MRRALMLPSLRSSLLAAAALLGAAVLASGAAPAWASDVYCRTVGKNLQCRDTPFEGAVLVRRSGQSGIVGQGEASAAATAAATPAAASAGATAADDRLRREQAARDVAADLAARRAADCKRATEAYDRAIQARRLYKTGPNGEQIYLSEAELAQARVDARTARDTACAPPR
jgi:hypothetical protein